MTVVPLPSDDRVDLVPPGRDRGPGHGQRGRRAVAPEGGLTDLQRVLIEPSSRP